MLEKQVNPVQPGDIALSFIYNSRYYLSQDSLDSTGLSPEEIIEQRYINRNEFLTGSKNLLRCSSLDYKNLQQVGQKLATLFDYGPYSHEFIEDRLEELTGVSLIKEQWGVFEPNRDDILTVYKFPRLSTYDAFIKYWRSFGV